MQWMLMKLTINTESLLIVIMAGEVAGLKMSTMSHARVKYFSRQ